MLPRQKPDGVRARPLGPRLLLNAEFEDEVMFEKKGLQKLYDSHRETFASAARVGDALNGRRLAAGDRLDAPTAD